MFKLLPLVFFILQAILINADSKSASSITEEQKAKLVEYSMQCMSESGVKSEEVAAIKTGKFSDSDNLKKFVFCLGKKVGVVTSEGDIDVETTLSKFPENADKAGVKKAIEECKNQSGKDATEKSYNFLKCYHAKTPVHLLL